MAHLRYITNHEGKKTDVVLSLTEYDRLMKKAGENPPAHLTKAQEKVKEEMRKEFEEAFDYIAEARAGRKPKLKARDLINEL
jgi:histone H3/H4